MIEQALQSRTGEELSCSSAMEKTDACVKADAALELASPSSVTSTPLSPQSFPSESTPPYQLSAFLPLQPCSSAPLHSCYYIHTLVKYIEIKYVHFVRTLCLILKSLLPTSSCSLKLASLELGLLAHGFPQTAGSAQECHILHTLLLCCRTAFRL